MQQIVFKSFHTKHKHSLKSYENIPTNLNLYLHMHYFFSNILVLQDVVMI